MAGAKRRRGRRAAQKISQLFGHALQLIVGPGRALLVGLCLAVVFVGGWRIAWRNVDPLVQRDPRYQLKLADIQITPPPDWIRGDIKTRAIRDAGLDQDASVLDSTLAERLSSAFEFHPWVESVSRVAKRSGAIVEVELVYRQPVAIVHISGRNEAEASPVDRHNVRLPSEDFAPRNRDEYPRIANITTEPLVGETWRDRRVTGGVQIAASLADVWSRLQLASIVPAEIPPGAGPERLVVFTLVTRGGRSIPWGHAPGKAPPGEPTAAEKRRRLLDYANQYGSLDLPTDQQALDLSRPPAYVGALPDDASR